MKFATTLAFLAATLPVVFGQGLNLDYPADNASVPVGSSVSFSWSVSTRLAPF